ncbi:MAG: MoaD family protein [Endomicrobiia bacterium]|nr:MoaD family protein [Endomicrobiia bacterium]
MTKHKPSVKIKFYPPLKDILGVGEVSLSARDVSDALEILSERYGEKFSSEVLEPGGGVKNYYILLLDDKPVNQQNPAAAKFRKGDVLHIFPPVAGG